MDGLRRQLGMSAVKRPLGRKTMKAMIIALTLLFTIGVAGTLIAAQAAFADCGGACN
jgi:hypothetical protein